MILCWFFASQNWFVEIKTRSTTFIFWPPQDYQPFEIKTTTNVSSFIILDCRKSNNSCWLSSLLIGSRTWSKGKSCRSHFIFCKSNLKWKISKGNQNLWLIFWFPLFRFYLCFHSWSEAGTYIDWRLRWALSNEREERQQILVPSKKNTKQNISKKTLF